MFLFGDKKELLSIFFGSAFIIAMSRLFACSKVRKVPVLAYHRIVDDESFETMVHSDGLVSSSVTAFREQLRYLKKSGYRSVLFLDMADKNFILPKKTVVITFDDGFSDNYSLAAAVLEEYGFKAVFFVATSFVESGRSYWFDEIRNILSIESNRRHVFDILRRYKCDDSLVSSGGVINTLKSINNDKRHAILVEIKNSPLIKKQCKSLGFPMNWCEVIKLSSSGHEIGSHTKTHPMLSRLSKEELKEEVCGSKEDIEDHIKKEVVSFSYPFGGYDSYNARVIDVVKKAGYLFACNYMSGLYNVDSIDGFFEINRLHIESDMSIRRFKAVLEFPKIISYRVN